VAQNANKNVKLMEKDLLKAAKSALKVNKKAADFTSLIGTDQQDEKELRDKLVSKLKEKEIEKMKVSGEKLRDNSFYNSDEANDMEDISEDELSQDRLTPKDDEDLSDNLDQVSDEDLRLTSSGGETPDGDDQDQEKKAKKHKKKKKKKKDEKREKRRKRRELEDHISLAQRIADRDPDKRSRSRDKDRDRDRDRHRDRDREHHREQRRNRSPNSSPKKHYRSRSRTPPPSWRNRREDAILERKAIIRDRILKERMDSRRKEQAMEEQYDQMVNPHLYGGPGGGYRKLVKGHYEDVQRAQLDNEIRIRERRERYQRNDRGHDREHHGGRRDDRRGGRPYPPSRGGRDVGYHRR